MHHMTNLRFVAMPTEDARHHQSGGADAYGMAPERRTSDGNGVPCRHCLTDVADGEDYLILAYRPFPDPQPYAETGPIFLHASACQRATDASSLPPMLAKRKAHLIKGYGADDRIVYGTGQIVAPDELEAASSKILAREDVAYVHVRSALNNCYTCRIDRA
jgi:hypothetical protein